MAFWTFAQALPRSTIRLTFRILAVVLALSALGTLVSLPGRIESVGVGAVHPVQLMNDVFYVLLAVAWIIMARLACEAVLAIQAIARARLSPSEPTPPSGT